MQQLIAASRAVYASWISDKACAYRRLQGLDFSEAPPSRCRPWCTATRVLAPGPASPFPAIPRPALACRRSTCCSRRKARTSCLAGARPRPRLSLRSVRLRQRRSSAAACGRSVQASYGEDVEFTIQHGWLGILRSRSAKRTPRATLKIAVDLVQEGIITQQEGLEQLRGLDLASLAIAHFASQELPPLRAGLPPPEGGGGRCRFRFGDGRAACGRGRVPSSCCAPISTPPTSRAWPPPAAWSRLRVAAPRMRH